MVCDTVSTLDGAKSIDRSECWMDLPKKLQPLLDCFPESRPVRIPINRIIGWYEVSLVFVLPEPEAITVSTCMLIFFFFQQILFKTHWEKWRSSSRSIYQRCCLTCIKCYQLQQGSRGAQCLIVLGHTIFHSISNYGGEKKPNVFHPVNIASKQKENLVKQVCDTVKGSIMHQWIQFIEQRGPVLD